MPVAITSPRRPIHTPTITTIEAMPGESILDLPPDEVRMAIRRGGVVLWRGYRVDLATFSALVNKHSSRTTLDPARQFCADNIQQVDSGLDEIGFHRENEMSPFQPDFVWFYCRRAAATGSETTVCDGERVWRVMAPAMRTLFWGKHLQYTRAIPERLWKTYVAYQHPAVHEVEHVTSSHLFELLRFARGCSATLREDGGIDFTRVVPAVAPGPLSKRMVFANSILGPSYNYQCPNILLDGKPIPDYVIAELARITAEVHEAVAWRDHDVVLIDNARVMHGRRRILDPNRSICIGLSMA